MPKETMTPRERWLAVITHHKPDRVPMDYWATGEATEKLMRHLGVGDHWEMRRRLHIESPVGVGGRYLGPQPPAGEDVWGCRFRNVQYSTGVYNECVYNPLAQYNSVEEIERNYTWPKNAWWDYSHIADDVRGKEDYPIQGGGSEPFMIYCYLRGQEQGLMDLALNPDIAHYCLGKLFEHAYQNTLRIYEQIPGKVMISYVAEDLGTQESLLMSLDHIREFLVPGMKRIIDLAHQAGAYVFHHSDGAVRPWIPEMIALGMDVLNPVQWRCAGMEREGLKRDFGDRLAFHGGVDNQYTLPFGAVEEVRQEVIDNIRILGAGGGYILAPCHNIQAVGPPENVVAMYQTGYEYGWY